MKFEKISKLSKSVYIDSREKFQQFYNDFGIVGVNGHSQLILVLHIF